MSSVIYNPSNMNSNQNIFPTTIASAAKMLKYQHIAPAPTSSVDGRHILPATRKYTPRATNAPYCVDQTQSVQRRNARERNRVKQVNNSFAKLRQHIPQTIIADLTKGGGRGPQKKISKVDTLRIAVEYIRRLQDLVEDLNGPSDTSSGSNFNSNMVCLNNMDTLSNMSFSSTSSGSSCTAVDSPAASAPPQTTAPCYTQAATSPLPSYQQQFSSAMLTPVSLNAFPMTMTQLDGGCASPTSSFNSSMSFDSGTYEPTPQQLASASSQPNTHLDAHLQLKFEPYDNFQLQEEDCQPDDEEILDYISLWQEQ